MLRKSVITLGVLLGTWACEYPTELPRWDQTWVVPAERITLNAAEFLPTDIDVNADTTAFVTETPEASILLDLGELCGTACLLLDGFEAEKPAFRDTLSTTAELPGDLVSATLAGGSLSAMVAHSFNFDLLRPSSDPADPRGFVVVRATSNGNVVAHDSISGDDRAFPGGTFIIPDLPIQPVDITDTLTFEIIVYSPAGDTTTIETSDTLGVTVAPSTVEIAEVTVNADAVTIDPVTTTMDFGGVDSTVVDHVESGSLLLDGMNPFTVTGTLDMSFQGITPMIQRSLTVPQGAFGEELTFTGEELRRILGADEVNVVSTGTVSAEGGTVTVTPSQELTLDADFELVVLIGPTEEL